MNTKNSQPNDRPPIPSAYSIRVFRGDADPVLLDRIGALRVQVWRDEGTKLPSDFPQGKWLDDQDQDAYHWAAFDKDQILVGSARLDFLEDLNKIQDRDWYNIPENLIRCPLAYFTKDVVNKNHRQRGLGKYFNYDRLDSAKKLGARTVLADIPTYRAESFDKLGFKTIQEPQFGSRLTEIRWAVVMKYL